MAKQLNCWVDDDLAEQVEAAADADHRSVSSWLRLLILSHLGEPAPAPADEVAA
jgi:hypothetical protein